jgi:hypothetical protein
MLRCENCGQRISPGLSHKFTEARSFVSLGTCKEFKRVAKKGK